MIKVQLLTRTVALLYIEPENVLKTYIAMHEHKIFERESLKQAYTCVYIDFSLKVMARTHVSEPGVNVA